MEAQGEQGSNGPAPKAAEEAAGYGVRVEIDPSSIERRSLGTFDTADVEGRLTVVSVAEELYATSAEGVKAVAYQFSKHPAGLFPAPKLWSFLSVFSGAVLITLFCLNLFKPELDLGLPSWIYYISFGLVFLIATALELKRVGEFLILSGTGKVLTELEDSYGRHPLMDLPAGKLADAKSKVEGVLRAMPPSRIKVSPSSLAVANMSSSSETEQRGNTHGKTS